MTENKRFMLDDAGELIDLKHHKFVDYGEDCCNLLNELAEEKEQLINDCNILVQSNQDYRKENEQLKKRLAEREKLLDVRDKIIGDVSKALNGDVE